MTSHRANLDRFPLVLKLPIRRGQFAHTPPRGWRSQGNFGLQRLDLGDCSRSGYVGIRGKPTPVLSRSGASVVDGFAVTCCSQEKRNL